MGAAASPSPSLSPSGDAKQRALAAELVSGRAAVLETNGEDKGTAKTNQLYQTSFVII